MSDSNFTGLVNDSSDGLGHAPAFSRDGFDIDLCKHLHSIMPSAYFFSVDYCICVKKFFFLHWRQNAIYYYIYVLYFFKLICVSIHSLNCYFFKRSSRCGLEEIALCDKAAFATFFVFWIFYGVQEYNYNKYIIIVFFNTISSLWSSIYCVYNKVITIDEKINLIIVLIKNFDLRLLTQFAVSLLSAPRVWVRFIYKCMYVHFSRHYVAYLRNRRVPVCQHMSVLIN